MTIDELLAAAGLTANDEIPIWDAESIGEPTKKITAQNLAAAVAALANLVTGVKGNTEANYRHGDVNITPADIGAVSTSDVIDIPHGGTGATTPAGACAALAPGIPTSSYNTGITWTSNTATYSADNGVRCIKYGNGLKRIVGLLSVSSSGVASGNTIFSVPAGYEHTTSNNGSLQGWGSITKSSGGASYVFRFSGNTVLAWGATVPEGTYAINYLYF